VPAEREGIIQHGAADPTSGSLRYADPKAGRSRGRRGTLVVPAEVRWIIKRSAADPTSGSLRYADPKAGRSRGRRGTLVVPAEARWIIKRSAADPTSGSLREANSEGHACRARRAGRDHPTWCSGPDERVPPRGEFGGARLSCPLKRDGASNVAQRTRRAGPSKRVPPGASRARVTKLPTNRPQPRLHPKAAVCRQTVSHGHRKLFPSGYAPQFQAIDATRIHM
jgi:hypothetical protein